MFYVGVHCQSFKEQLRTIILIAYCEFARHDSHAVPCAHRALDRDAAHAVAVGRAVRAIHANSEVEVLLPRTARGDRAVAAELRGRQHGHSQARDGALDQGVIGPARRLLRRAERREVANRRVHAAVEGAEARGRAVRAPLVLHVKPRCTEIEHGREGMLEH